MHPIESLFAAYSDAVYKKDEAAFTAIFDDNLHVFDMWAWSYEGLDSWREMVHGWFGSLGEERCVVSFDDIRVQAGEEIASATAIAKFEAFDAQNQSLRHLYNRLTWVAQKKQGVWKIVHEHTSGPADHQTLKIQLQR